MAVLLEDKNAIIYGGGSSVGSAVARAFDSEEAMVFHAGRTRKSLEAAAAGVTVAGGCAEGKDG